MGELSAQGISTFSQTLFLRRSPIVLLNLSAKAARNELFLEKYYYMLLCITKF